MKDQDSLTFISTDKPLTMNDVMPMFHYLGLSEDKIALFFGMRPKSPYAEKYIANGTQELNHLQVYAARSMDHVITVGLMNQSHETFLEWINTPNAELKNSSPKSLLIDITKHASLLELLR